MTTGRFSVLLCPPFEEVKRRQDCRVSVQLVPYGQIDVLVKLIVQPHGLFDKIDSRFENNCKAVGLKPENLLIARVSSGTPKSSTTNAMAVNFYMYSFTRLDFCVRHAHLFHYTLRHFNDSRLAFETVVGSCL